jgi:hypothetical protein
MSHVFFNNVFTSKVEAIRHEDSVTFPVRAWNAVFRNSKVAPLPETSPYVERELKSDTSGEIERAVQLSPMNAALSPIAEVSEYATLRESLAYESAQLVEGFKEHFD